MERYSAVLRVRHCQLDGEEVVSEGETRVNGEMTRTPEGWRLRYEEPPDNESGVARVEMALLNGEVRVRRFGQTSSEVTYREQRESLMRYELGGYGLSLRVLPKRVIWAIDPPGGNISLEYLLQMGDSGFLRHAVEIDVESMGPLDLPLEGSELRGAAHRLLSMSLGEHWGFVRWADRREWLLVTDAGRAAKRQGADAAFMQERLTSAGWRVTEADELWWLDPPDEAFHRALLDRRLDVGTELGGWRDGELGELQAYCGSLLRDDAFTTRPGTLDEATCALLRDAWKHFEQAPSHVSHWMRGQMRLFAAARRAGNPGAEYACGVLLQRYLRRHGCDLPPETLAAPDWPRHS